MAQDWEQKSVQGIKDPTARKAAYYKLQRETAEDGQDYKTQDKINSKLGKKTQKTTWNEPQASVERDANIGLALTPMGRAEGAGTALAKGAAKYVPKAAEAVKSAGSGLAELGAKASQWLGKAKPVAAKLAGGVEKKAASTGAKALKGAEQKALSGGKASETKALSGPKGAGKAKSSPMKRETANSMRYNPQSGKMVGKSPMRIQSDAIERRGRKAAMENTADMNKAAAKTPKESLVSKVKNKAARTSLGSKTPVGHGVAAAGFGAASEKVAKNKSAKSKARGV